MRPNFKTVFVAAAVRDDADEAQSAAARLMGSFLAAAGYAVHFQSGQGLNAKLIAGAHTWPGARDRITLPDAGKTPPAGDGTLILPGGMEVLAAMARTGDTARAHALLNTPGRLVVVLDTNDYFAPLRARWAYASAAEAPIPADTSHFSFVSTPHNAIMLLNRRLGMTPAGHT